MDKKNKLIRRLSSKGYKLIEDDVYNISKRIRQYDKDLLLFFNPSNGAYEIHTSLSLPSYCVSSDVLDSRLLLKLKRADNRTEYGMREKMDEIEREQEEKEKASQRHFDDLRQNVLRECERKFF